MNAAISHLTGTFVENDDQMMDLHQSIMTRLKVTEDKLFLPLAETKELLQSLMGFELGRFLLRNKGLNGYWTSYVIKQRKSPSDHPLENWILQKSLMPLLRERFITFKRLLQERLISNMTLGSVPCGLMDDLLELDYSKVQNINLVGMDADLESLSFAHESAKLKGLEEQCSFIQKDAWELGIKEEFDVLTSNGLNMYVSDPKRLVELYKQFNLSLKPGGTLLISFLPPPPDDSDPNYSVDSFGISKEDFIKERAIMHDIIGINYLNFCSEQQMREQLLAAGFLIEGVIYNKQGVIPIAVAKKQ